MWVKMIRKFFEQFQLVYPVIRYKEFKKLEKPQGLKEMEDRHA